jgi:aminopeptidase N
MKRSWFIVVALFFGCAGSAPPATPKPGAVGPHVAAATEVPPPRDDGRLPPGVRPTRYTLDLTIDPSQTTFTGKAQVSVKLAQSARAIVMHGRDLTVRTVVAKTSQGTAAGKARSRLAFGATEGPDELVLEFDRDLPAGDAELDLEYAAPFSQQQRGLFRVEISGAEYAVTNFEPIDARRMFPCFDEPAHKTPFQVTLHVPKGSLAFSNTSETRRSEDAVAGLVTFAFEPSEPLPTYLVALAVGPFEVLEGPKTPVPLRVIAAKGKASLGKIALETAAAHLALYATYFDLPYPYAKLDLVAVPDFHGDAMENAGLITFREELLLLHEGASVGARRQLADAIGHEAAHHWFGNLVTMQWWDEIWLKESFTQWITAKTIDQWKPEIKAGLMQAGSQSWAMQRDALETARPIRSAVRTAQEIIDYNPLIFYKGAPLIGMVEGWLGADAFREGVRRYMKAHRWSSVTSVDLFAALAESSGGRDVQGVVESFVAQSGVPVVHAELDCGSPAAPFIRLRQEEFRYLDRKEASDKRWRIPVCVRHDAGGELAMQCTLLDGQEGRLELTAAQGRASACPSFFYPNADDVGYYRVRLTPADLDKLAERGLGKLTERERLGLVGHAWASVWSGHLRVAAHFELLRGYRKETSQMVLEQMLDTLIDADKAAVTDASRPAFARFVRDLFRDSARRLGWAAKKGESEEAKLTRNELLFAMGVLGQDAATRAEGTRVANAWFADPTRVDPEIAGLAIGLAATSGGAALFERLLGVLKTAKTPELRQIARRGLTAFDSPPLVERALDLTLDGTLKTQDLRDVLFAFLRRKNTVDVAFAWAEKHFDEITKASSQVPMVLARTPFAMCDTERVRSVEAFLRPRLEKLGAAKELDEYLDVARRCAALAAKETEPTRAWLAARGNAR